MLLVAMDQMSHRIMVHLNFLVVRILLVYNFILRLSGLNALQAIISTYHLMMKLPIEHVISELQDDQTLAQQCYDGSSKSHPT